jgi:hypothetical protein
LYTVSEKYVASRRKKASPNFSGDLVYSSIRTAKSNKPGHSVHLTLRFGEQRFHFQKLGVTIADLYVGVCHAFLNFGLNDCVMPDEDWAIDPPIEVERAVDRVVGDTHSGKQHRSASSKGSLKGAVSAAAPTGESGAEVEVATAESTEQQTRETVSDQFARTLSFVTARGGPGNPSWDIGCPSDDRILRGALFKDQHFCRVVPTGDTPQATVTLEIPKDGLVIKDKTGAYDLLPNKRALTRMLLSREFCQEPLLLIESEFGVKKDGR